MTLDVAISTYSPAGIRRVEKMLPPKKKGVNYVVSWQQNEKSEIPASLLRRDDVKIIRYDKSGLSNNRNNAIDHCKGDLILIADDDLEYYEDFAEKILSVFESNPNLGLATFKIDFPKKKNYPEKECKLTIPYPSSYYVSSVEIAFRREKVRNLYFFPTLGLGAPDMHCGEEELFVTSAINRNIDCHFFPVSIAKHPEITSGNKITKEILKGQGFVIGILYPFSFILRLPLKAYRMTKNNSYSFIKALYHLGKGVFKYKEMRKSIPEKYRW